MPFIIRKNWCKNLRIGCKSLHSLADFIENDFNLEEKFEEFEGAFERDEVVELQILNKTSPNFHVF
jgi:hypothetical protein